MSWKESRQWRSTKRDANITIDVCITREVGAVSCVWWVDGFDRSTMQSPEPVSGFAGTLRETKREALKAAQAMLAHLLWARGGA